MRVVPDGAASIYLGTVETAPTIGITDYSARITDAFGVTTVVERGFSRTMSVRLAVPFNRVDALQRQLANLRATTAQWIADDTVGGLSVRGFYKDFDLDLAVPPLSYCTLTVEGIAETDVVADPGGDPAPAGQASTLQLLQPVAVTDQALVASSVAETDAPAWDAATSYAVGARVVRTAVHRVYQSTTDRNAGNAPETSPAVWLDLGPTNRWAMFDQALGTATTGMSQIVVTLAAPHAVTGLAILDTDAASVRVQAPGYDDTVPRNSAGAIVFADLAVAAGANVTVTINAAGGAAVPRVWDDAGTWSDAHARQDSDPAPGNGPVSVGTLLFGTVVSLGITEASPTAGIIDYSRKDVDDFGAVTIVQRAWSKKMAAKALIDTAAVGIVANRIASVRAVPSLWIGQAGLDSLTIYGFFKDFSIEVGETTSKLSLSIEGLSKAAPIAPLTIDFDNVTGADKPEAGATRNVPRGAWSATVAYDQGDIVTYQGASYIAGEAVPIGIAPTNTLYWDVLAQGGGAGTPGPAGKDGTPSYVHVAYASSPDGSTGFVTGLANPGRPYIGIYTDAISAGSSDYRAYHWSRLTGADGVNGTNGTPGPIGADGRQSYVHFAYADSVDGKTNFTTGDPGPRTYLGVYSDYIEPDSNDPTLYAWSSIKGPQGIPGPPAADGSAAFVHIAYANSADGSQDFVAGIANPGRLYIGIYTDGYSTGSGDYHSYNWSRLTGKDGLNGANGTPGPVGADGRQTYVHFAYADSADGTVNFTVNAPGARKYIGVYSDYTIADSGSPAAYRWSLIKGSDGAVGAPGTPGTNGTPGANGKDGTNGAPGASAPQVIIQYSADKANWHGAAAAGDIYLRLSYDGGATFGNAILIQGGGFVFAFYRTAGTPPTPSTAPGAANPPAGWASADPGGAGQLWFTFARIDGTGYNLTGWSAPTKVQGQDGANGGPGSPGMNGTNGTNGVDGLSALKIHTVGAVSWDGHNLNCPSPANSWTVNGAYSDNVTPGGVSLSFLRPNTFGNEDGFVGISSAPTANIDYSGVEFAWRMAQDGNNYNAYAWHAGTQLYAEGWNGFYTYSIRYDNSTGIVSWYRTDPSGNAVVVMTYNAGRGRAFGFEATARLNMSVANVAFVAAGGTGDTGPAGPPGANGTSVLGAGFGAILTIGIAAGGTAGLTGQAALSRSNGGGNVTCGLQWSYSGYNSWNTLASDAEAVSPNEPANCYSVANLTNSGSTRRLYDVRYAYIGGSTANLTFDSANSFISAQVPS